MKFIAPVDKHRLLLTVGCAYTVLSLDLAEQMRASGPEWAKDIPETRLGLRPAEKLLPLQDGAELYRIESAARRRVRGVEKHAGAPRKSTFAAALLRVQATSHRAPSIIGGGCERVR